MTNEKTAHDRVPRTSHKVRRPLTRDVEEAKGRLPESACVRPAEGRGRPGPGAGPVRKKRPAADEAEAAWRPIASLISKSEKAQMKVAPGTWQHAMLGDNLRALRMATDLMNRGAGGAARWTRGDLRAAQQACAAMMARTEKARAGFAPGTSPHTLLCNRLRALRVAKDLIRAESRRRGAAEGGGDA